MRIAVLGPGGVGGLIAAALANAGEDVLVVARPETAAAIAAQGIAVDSVRLGEFVARPRVASALAEDADALIVATKAVTLAAALERIERTPALVVPLLNGLDHLPLLRERFGPERVAAAVIRVESDRPQAGVVVHTSPFLRVDMAGPDALRPALERFAAALEQAGVPSRILASEAQVMWEKLVRLNALALTTSAWDKQLGEIFATPALRAQLEAAIAEGCAVARAEGAELEAAQPLGELEAAHDSLGSSMQRDIAAGREPEIEAIPGAVLRAAARHGIGCPTIEALTAEIRARAAA